MTTPCHSDDRIQSLARRHRPRVRPIGVMAVAGQVAKAIDQFFGKLAAALISST